MRRASDGGTVLRKSWPAQPGAPVPRPPCCPEPMSHCTTALLSHWLAAAQEAHTSLLKAEADPETGGCQLTQLLEPGSILKGDPSHAHQ